MSASPQVLIAGAGPTGLAAALFLTRAGVSVRLIDAAPEPTTTSKALAVNPRTLELLEPTGVADRIRAEGQDIHAIRIARDGRVVATLAPRWDRIAPGRPMTILPQARTEGLLAEALAQLGVHPERGLGLSGLTQDAEGATDTPWHLADVDIEGAPQDEGRIEFQRAGPLIILPFSGGTFRLIGFGADLLPRLPQGWTVARVRWTSEFRVSHRMVPAMAVGRVALAGDAAHIHSPIGGRGMNLGIEDAFVFAACVVDALNGQPDRLADYDRLRRKIDGDWVAASRRLTGFVQDPSPRARFIKRFAPPIAAAFPGLIDRALKAGMGLDHPVRTR
jgi:2-polyprenyl-6-methoxyphenol hydroxylase-like FAD-dependent oxidoreductase